MKGIQVSIDVSESEIVPKAFQRPAVSGVRARGASASVCSLAARRKISSHKQGGRGKKTTGIIIKKMCQKCFLAIFLGRGGGMKVFCPVSRMELR